MTATPAKLGHAADNKHLVSNDLITNEADWLEALGFKQHASDPDTWLYHEGGLMLCIRLTFIRTSAKGPDTVPRLFLGEGASGLPYLNMPQTRRGVLRILQALGFPKALMFDGIEPWDPSPGQIFPEMYFVRNPKLGTEWGRGNESGQPRRTTGVYRDLVYALPKVVQ